MNWKPISEPPSKVTRGILLWDGECWWEGVYSKTDGFRAYEEDIEGPYTHYLIVVPPSEDSHG